MVHNLTKRYGLTLHSFIVPGAWDVYAKVGHFFTRPMTVEEREATNAMLSGYKRAAAGEAEAANYIGLFWGLRSKESSQRGMTLARKGTCYRVADRSTWTCCPLANWSAVDVWAYLISRELPWLARYGMSNIMSREAERSEPTWLAAESLWRKGQCQRLQEGGRGEFNALLLRFPELRRLI
jgi:3'-phosphoadenosine 5'-phosphosulfate sulfotransferase (PAPS reductase)/FAD synthetase